MTALTTRQRDILKILIETSQPLGMTEIAGMMNLSPRQVSYSLKGVKSWLAQKEIPLIVTPGVGVLLDASPTQSNQLVREFRSRTGLQLVLSAGQRQQLLALLLLTSAEPLILSHIEYLAQVSRATALKDLDEIAPWLAGWGLELVRKPNFGIQVEGAEIVRQQAMAALVWGEVPFEDVLTSMSHNVGLEFSLAQDAALLPLVNEAKQTLGGWNTTRITGQVAYAEDQLGGRFTDDAVLHLTLALAILTGRVQHGHHIQVDPAELEWLQNQPLWQVARMVALRIGLQPSDEWQPADIACIAMQFLAAPRSEVWSGDSEHEPENTALIDLLVEHICQAYSQPAFREDRTLRDGLFNHIIPATLRQRFGLWYPSLHAQEMAEEEYPFEYQTASELARIVRGKVSIDLPQNEISNLAMLLRAAFIRIRPYRFHQVIVVCPSGMATAQLLVARLEARFPRLGTLKVISLRQFNAETAATADLILTTVPLSEAIVSTYNVIQVHPLLLQADIDAITRFLS